MNVREIKLFIKNILGKKTDRKLLAFYVDDWGSVRTKDKKAIDYLQAKGVKFIGHGSHFSRLDSLECNDDLTSLFEVLSSVKDKNGNGACFTAVMNPCNPNFEAIKANGFTEFISEPFTETLKKYGKGYENVFDLWQEGIKKNLFYPMFHGTEHVSRKQWMRALTDDENPEQWAFECESVGVPDVEGYKSYSGTMQPYYIETANDNIALAENIKKGTSAIENLFGFKTRQFKAGGDVVSPELRPILKECGIEYLDEGLYIKKHIGDGKYVTSVNYFGKINKIGQKILVRNCMFEPCGEYSTTLGNVDNCMEEIDMAFRCGKPAVISSHRVNYVGSISPKNRENGLSKLKSLLEEVVRKYPDVEFVNADQLGDIIFKKQN
ncbi:MAG: hypothetical protein RRZ64_08580 [Rikenellaceae bacterium]